MSAHSDAASYRSWRRAGRHRLTQLLEAELGIGPAFSQILVYELIRGGYDIDNRDPCIRLILALGAAFDNRSQP